VTKFSELHPLSLQDVPILMIVVLFNYMLERYEHSFRSRHMKTFKIKYMKTLMFTFQSNKASVLDHIALIYYPIYSVAIVLHACVNECTPMLGFTRTAYPSMKARSHWVGVIGLELLSLA
jgi:hypothetical protein